MKKKSNVSIKIKMQYSIHASSAVWIGDLKAAQVKYEKVLGPKDAIFAMNPGRSL